MIPAYIANVSVDEYLKHDYYRNIAPLIKNKVVLDVGCVDHDISSANEKRLWNHWFIRLTARRVVGIDIEGESIEKMKRMGLNAHLMSAEKISYKNKFDVVFAGELIEHLPNPGLFLTSAKRALKHGGKIILSTPNTYSVNRFVRVLQLRSNEPPQNEDHTMCFTPKNLETLAGKCGLSIKKLEYAYFPFTKGTLIIKGNRIACRILGEKFKEQMIAILQ